MKLYKRKDFLKLPKKTIYSKIDENISETWHGLFCKTSDSNDMRDDWVEQDLISEGFAPNNLKSGADIINYVLAQRDSFQDFKLDYNMAGRDGMFEENNTFIVWNNKDINRLAKYLLNCINS